MPGANHSPATTHFQPHRPYPAYPSLTGGILRATGAGLFGQHRSFRADALQWTAEIDALFKTFGTENIPTGGPCLLTVNHYSRPGFSAAWLALGLTTLLPVEVTWVMVDTWAYQDHPLGFLLRPLGHFILSAIIRTYSFIPMPTVIPGFASPAEKSISIRRTVAAVRANPSVLLGLAPEGQDHPGGRLGMPPPGAGRFILHLNRLGLPILPVGVWEQDARLCFSFGKPYHLQIPEATASYALDDWARRQVMEEIAMLLPSEISNPPWN